MSGDILDQIDHALEDWGTSPDAMRWTPEATPVTAQPDMGAMLTSFSNAALVVNQTMAKIAAAYMTAMKAVVAIHKQLIVLREGEATVVRSARWSEYNRRRRNR